VCKNGGAKLKKKKIKFERAKFKKLRDNFLLFLKNFIFKRKFWGLGGQGSYAGPPLPLYKD